MREVCGIMNYLDINQLTLEKCDELIKSLKKDLEHAYASAMTGILDHRVGLEVYGWAELNIARQRLSQVEAHREKLLKEKRAKK